MRSFSPQEIARMRRQGVTPEMIETQLHNFETGFPYLPIDRPATVGDGIFVISEEDVAGILSCYHTVVRHRRIVKMVPASGSATRMFKSLVAYANSHVEGEPVPEEIQLFFSRITEFPFYSNLREAMYTDGADLLKYVIEKRYVDILKYLLYEKGLNYANTPKGLVDFHTYPVEEVRTPFIEHIIEANGFLEEESKLRLHFTVSPEHRERFVNTLSANRRLLRKKIAKQISVSFSEQSPATDTISLNPDGTIVLDDKGEILFRPGGHGALIQNLNRISADFVVLKNIDNIAPEWNQTVSIRQQQLLIGLLASIQKRCFHYINQLSRTTRLNKAIIDEVIAFASKYLGYTCSVVDEKAYAKPRELAINLIKVLNRPIRVCGMVRNQGEPGGGPFWVKDAFGNSTLMILEQAQIDRSDPWQVAALKAATHFNPVDMVCGIYNKNHTKFNLSRFVDENQGFISEKSYQGKTIRVQELPGLWNGAMGKWNTLFVEIPLEAFTPVKTVFDLLRPEHQPKTQV